MRCRHAITLVEVVVVCVILVLIVLVLTPGRGHRGEISSRSKCGANLSWIYKAMYTYSVTEKDRFPIAGEADEAGRATGFREGDRAAGTGAVLDNNVTASLWLMVRDGSCGVGQFVCPNSGGTYDPLTTTADGSTGATLENTRDFRSPDHLSFSPINMYHAAASKQWGSAVKADYVLMGDANNNASEGKRHTLVKSADGPSERDVRTYENSPNHDGGEGQNLLKGDGSTTFSNDPFQGPGGDNAYAMIVGGLNAPPRLGHRDGDAASDEEVGKTDAVLIPLTGNGGVSLSGLPGVRSEASAASSGEGRGRGGRRWGGAIVFAVVFFALVYGIDRWTARRGIRGEEPPDPPVPPDPR